MTIHHGDCLDIMRTMDDDSIDLIMTSPPYAMQRSKQYGGIPEDEYVDWWMVRAEQMKRILKPTGSLVVNIKEHVKDGQRSLYVYDMVSAMVRRQGWCWTDDYCWYKTTSMPGKFVGRFRNAWEHCYHFTLSAGYIFNQDAVSRETKNSTLKRARSNCAGNDVRQTSATGSGFGVTSRHMDKPISCPDNVLVGAPETKSVKSLPVNHAAIFPEWLPSWFIKLLTDHGDTVLDPFSGSGTTVRAARKLNRIGIGIEINEQYITGGEMERWLS